MKINKYLQFFSVFLILTIIISTFASCKTAPIEESSSNEESSFDESDLFSHDDSSESEEENDDLLDTKQEVNIAFLKGPTGLGATFLLDKNENNETKNKYNHIIAGSADEIIPKLLNGELDIAALPTNVASTLYNKTNGEMQILAINNLGSFKIITSDESIFSLEDLKYKTITLAGQGATPEYALRYVLSKNNIDPDNDLEFSFLTENAEVATAIIANQVDIVLLPEPFATQVLTKVEGGTKMAVDISKEWQEVAELSTFTVGCIVARTKFVQDNLDVIMNFLTEYEESINLTLNDVQTASILSERFDIMTADIAEMAIPEANLTYIDYTKNMKEQVSGFLKVLYDANPESIGGNLPGDDFYYQS